MDNEELAQILLAASGQNKGGMFGVSLLDQYNNAQSGLDKLNNIYNTVVDENGVNKDQYNRWSSILGSQKAQAGIGMGLAGLQGLTSILGTTSSMAEIADTSGYQNQIRDIQRIGTTDYGNFDHIATDYGILDRTPSTFDYDKIRGGSTAERIGSTASSVLSGASTGMQIAGPWGALGGAVIGGGIAAARWLQGNRAAETEQKRLQVEDTMARNGAVRNLGAANNTLMDRFFRSGITTRAEYGGKIERKEQTLKEFADRVLNAKKQNTVTHSSGIVRKHCKGGTMIRIKR